MEKKAKRLKKIERENPRLGKVIFYLILNTQILEAAIWGV